MDAKFLEKIILKGCMADKGFLATITSTFKPEYFDDPVISEIFTFLKSHLEQYDKIPPKDAIRGSLSHHDDEIREIFSETEALDFDIAKNWDYLLKESNEYLKDKAVKRAILDSVDVINTGKAEERGKIRELVEQALAKDLRIDIGLDYFEMLGERLRRIFTTSSNRIRTYFPQFDEYLNGGFPPFTFSVIVARVHGFKSNTLANIAARQVLHGHNVFLCTLEMSEDAFAQRFDSIFSKLDINKIYTLEAMKTQLISKLREVKSTPDRGKLVIKQFPTGEASVQDIKRLIREWIIRGVKPDIIYLDYINIMKPTYSGKDNLYSDVKRIAEECRAMSFQFECPVVSVSQLNREGSMIAFDEVDFVYIAESMGVPATADFMAIYGVDDEKLIYESELHYKIVKNRIGGRVGEVDKFYYDTRTLKMYDTSELELWLEDAKETGDERKAVLIGQEQRGQRRRK